MRTKPPVQPIIYGKVPPQALELEDAVIAACLLERETYEDVSEIITHPEFFYLDHNQKIYAAIQELHVTGTPVDLLTVSNELRKRNELELVGGLYKLTTLTQTITSTAHCVSHAMIVAEKFKAREVIRICSKAISDAYDDSTDVFDLLTDTEKEIQKVSEGTSVSEFVAVGETYTELMMDIEERKYETEGLTGIDTGYGELNAVTDGWQPSNLILLAARPSQGKTALALNFAINADCGVLIFSLEANKKELVKRFAAMKTGVFFSAVKKGQLTQFQETEMLKHINYFQKADIAIDDKTQHLQKIITGIRRKKKKNPNIKLVIVDYIQLIRGSKDKNSNREQEVASISRELKLIASELEITVIALSQLNRDVEKTVTKRPSLANLRESGALEQDANIVLMIYNKQVSENEVENYLLIEKNRDGECCDIKLKFSGEIQKWVQPEMMTPPDNPRAGFNNRLPFKAEPDEDAPF